MKIDDLSERAPPSNKGQRFLAKARKDFRKRYGQAWKRVLYATAWKMFGTDQMMESIMAGSIPSRTVRDAYADIPLTTIDLLPGDTDVELEIAHVRVEPLARGQGRAKEALRRLCTLADEHGVVLTLKPIPDDDSTLDDDALRAFYMGMDFHWEVVDGSAMMRRRPVNNLEQGVLTEGLLKVPGTTLDHINFLATYNILHYVKSRFTKHGSNLKDEYPEHWAGLLNSIQKFGVGIPDTQYRGGEVYVDRVPLDVEEVKAAYKGNAPSVDSLLLAIAWNNDADAGGYLPEKNTIVIFPLANNYISHFPDGPHSHPNDISVSMVNIKGTIEHELRHAMQFLVLGKYAAQKKTKPGYEKNGVDYHTSPIEFDPSIGSAVEQFMILWSHRNEGNNLDEKSLEDAVKKFVGTIPSRPNDLFEPMAFFRNLKSGAPVRYRRAVKKFIVELTKQLS